MIAALLAALGVVAVLVVALVLVVGRTLREGGRRERQLLDLLREDRTSSRETLDRVMYATGKPWEAPPVSEAVDEPEQFDAWAAAITTEPVSGADYPSPWVEDAAPIEAFMGASETFDTRASGDAL